MLATCPGAVPSAASWGMWEPRCPQAPLPLRGPLCLWPRWSASQRARALDIRGPPPRPPSGLLRRCTRLPCAERRPQEPASGPHTEAEAEAWLFGAAPAPVSQRFLSTSSQPLGEKAVWLCPLPARGDPPRGGGRSASALRGSRRFPRLGLLLVTTAWALSRAIFFLHVSPLVLDFLPI